ncbi:MAG: YtxH domain-containing protein [Nitritalea sp.]
MSSTKFLLGVLLGAAVGVQAGILLAPDKGKNTRKKLTKQGEKYWDEASDKLGGLLDGLNKKVDEVSGEVDKLAKKTKNEIEKAVK